MITNIMAGPYLTVSSGSGQYYNSTGMPMAGMLRYHSGGQVEVYNGSSWQTVSSNASIALSSVAEAALSWAIKKMNEEIELEKMAKEHPAIKLAVDNVRKAEEQLKTTVILTKEEQANTTQYHPV